jgi:hypothetical protein
MLQRFQPCGPVVWQLQQHKSNRATIRNASAQAAPKRKKIGRPRLAQPAPQFMLATQHNPTGPSFPS